jgi:hypothetical protein
MQAPKVVRAKARNLCPAEFGPDDDPGLCTLKDMILTEKDFRDPCKNSKSRKPKDCGKREYRNSRYTIALTLWIPIDGPPGTEQNISFDEVQCSKVRKNEKDPAEEICLPIATAPSAGGKQR